LGIPGSLPENAMLVGVIDGKAPSCKTASYKLVQNLRIEFEIIPDPFAYWFGKIKLHFLPILSDYNKRLNAQFLFCRFDFRLIFA
jgi:hypothetical protein